MTIHATPSSARSSRPAISPETRDALAASLEAAAASRERQLAELPPARGDLVAAAHRDSVERILSEIRAAQARLETERFGRCERCSVAIPPARLELRPWTALCVGCAHLVQS